MKHKEKNQSLFLRRAVWEDCAFLLQLANDDECRKSSFNQDKISLDTHIKWLKQVLCSETVKLYILMDQTEAIGQGRLELLENRCRISYSIIPKRRGGGYGKELIWLLCHAMLRDFSNCSVCYGEVLKTNVASQKVFEDLGYLAVNETEKYMIYEKNVFDVKKFVDMPQYRGGGGTYSK